MHNERVSAAIKKATLLTHLEAIKTYHWSLEISQRKWTSTYRGVGVLHRGPRK
jgi:hypothetical protein